MKFKILALSLFVITSLTSSFIEAGCKCNKGGKCTCTVCTCCK